MTKDELINTLAQQLRAVQAERQAARRDPALQAARVALKRHQSVRLGQTHADLLAAPSTRAAAVFFLDELYGAHDLSQRDADLERIIPTMQRLLPLPALQAITQAVVLDALSERLDTAMAQALGPLISEDGYADAYRSASPRAARERQLELIEALGRSLTELVRIPLLSATLGLMRGPARLAGLGGLQQFLEHGFAAFKQMRQPAAFVDTIVRRERAALANIHAGRGDPFDVF